MFGVCVLCVKSEAKDFGMRCGGERCVVDVEVGLEFVLVCVRCDESGCCFGGIEEKIVCFGPPTDVFEVRLECSVCCGWVCVGGCR